MFACLLIPRFRLQASLRWNGGASPALVAEEDLVLEADDAALARGILPGMTSSQALARDAQIRILSRAPEREHVLNQSLIHAAFRLSADVEWTRDGVCVADLRQRPSPPHWTLWAQSVAEELRAEGLDARVGVAATPDLAVLAARGATHAAVAEDAAAFAARLPLEALDPSPELRRTLEDWGVRSVGDFLALPGAEMAERLGPEASAMARRMSGRAPRPLRRVSLPAKYEEAFDFEDPIESVEPLLFLLRRFLSALCRRLIADRRVAERARLALPLEDRSVHKREFAIPSPTADEDTLLRVLNTHLETLRLERRPTGVRLEIRASLPKRDQLGLFETTLRDLNRFGETLARLKALLGEDRVGVPLHLDSHRPDAWAWDEGFAPRGAEAAPAESARPLGIPLRRFRPAMPARVALAGRRPSAIRCAAFEGEVSDLAGPYPLSGDWWGEASWAVEEWDVEMADGGLYRLARRGGEWTVEGGYEIC